MKLTDLSKEQLEAINYLHSVTPQQGDRIEDPVEWYEFVQTFNLDALYRQAKINKLQVVVNDMDLLDKEEVEAIAEIIKEKADKKRPKPVEPEPKPKLVGIKV